MGTSESSTHFVQVGEEKQDRLHSQEIRSTWARLATRMQQMQQPFLGGPGTASRGTLPKLWVERESLASTMKTSRPDYGCHD